MKNNILKTTLGMILILIFMGLIFNFKINLVWTHGEAIKTNIILWPIQQFTELLTYKWMHVDNANERFASTFSFFITELPYIFILIFMFSYLFNFARAFSTDKEITEWLSTKNGFGGRLMGSLIGFVSPFCSCSTIPIMNTLAKSRAPFGTVVSFLITSPMINEAGIAIMWAYWGYKITLIYIAFGFLIGIIGSYVATTLKLHDQFRIKLDKPEEDSNVLSRKITFSYLHNKAWYEAKKIFKGIWWIMAIALLIGAFMHGWIPQEWIRNNVGNNWWAPIALVPIGMLLYLNISATLPITKELVDGGLGLGPALSFTMGVNTISLPEIIMLTKIFKRKFMYFFVIYLVLAILIFAYILMLIPDSVLI